MTLEQEIIEVVVQQLGVSQDEVTLDKRFIEDLNADSLDLTELIMSFEEKFDCEISEEDAEKIRTVQDAVNFIRSKQE